MNYSSTKKIFLISLFSNNRTKKNIAARLRYISSKKLKLNYCSNDIGKIVFDLSLE